ncbi:MAG: beta-N-acetylhexosaminidase [Neptuniibacter sp.]|nr:beta-N-acetylhexosaminidase [Neptuniibacter sp.]
MPQASLFLDLDGTTLTSQERELLMSPLIGGVILFGRNSESAEQVSQLVADIRTIRSDLILSIDQEGGRVQRLKNGVARLPPVQALLPIYQNDKNDGLLAAEKLGYLMAIEMRSLDVDISFAPVLDVDYGRNTVIANRAFATDSESVAVLSESYIAGMRKAGMAATGKHFPGHGWANADTHLADAIDERSFEQIWNLDMSPFRAAIDNGLEAMMFAHVLYTSCDPSPAGFSQFWIEEILRKRLQFNGLIFSDDLSMKAAHSAGSYSQRAEQAISAGCQVLLCCNERAGTLEILEYLRQVECQPLDLNRLRGKTEIGFDEAYLKEARALAKSLVEE